MSNLDILPVRNCLKRLAVCNHIDSVFLIYMAALLNIDSTSGTKFSPPKKGGENEYGIFTRKLLSPHADVTYIFFGPSVKRFTKEQNSYHSLDRCLVKHLLQAN